MKNVRSVEKRIEKRPEPASDSRNRASFKRLLPLNDHKNYVLIIAKRTAEVKVMKRRRWADSGLVMGIILSTKAID